MKIIRSDEGVNYLSPGLFGGEFLSKIDDSIEGNHHLGVTISHFQPGGGCEYSAIPSGISNLVYYILDGQITVATERESFVMKTGDCVIFNNGEIRGFVNDCDKVTKLMMIVGK